MLAFVAPLPSVTDDASDGDVARRIARGGADGKVAEGALCGRFAARIRLYGRRHLGSDDEARDLVQLVLVRVLEALRAGKVDTPESLGSFVLGTCRYVASEMRRGEHRQRAIAAEVLAVHQDVEPGRMSGSDVIRLFSCIRRLPERERLVIRMTFMEDRDTDEIASRLELTAGNVRVVRHRALAKLHDCLESGGGP
jgi:RNA polymerase sigma-70 factor (ECF subfamily)